MIFEHRRARKNPRALPDIEEARAAISDDVMSAARDASSVLTSLGIPHALIGGIAVGCYGAARATGDVDFLVHEADAFVGSTVLSFRGGVPIVVRGVSIDYLTPEGSPYRALLDEALRTAHEGPVPIIPLEGLVIMKLEAGRRRDLDDVRRLLAAADVEDHVRRYVTKHAPGLVRELDLALRHA